MANRAKKICAVIAEYNPFHNGHAYQLSRAKELTGADFMAVMMSGCFTQRGEAALFSPFVRAEMAMRCGADIVFASPVSVSVREADTYALHNIMLLNKLKYITHLSFGAECGDLTLLDEIARILESPNAELDRVYKERLDSHMCSHAEALCDALEQAYGVPGDIVSTPNNILAVSYLRALRRTGSKIQPVVVHRKKSYHAKEVDVDYPSATSLRDAIRRGDWETVRSGVPDPVYQLMQQAVLKGEISMEQNSDRLLQYRLGTIKREEFWALPDAYEGVENLIFKRNRAICAREELIRNTATRRYSMARVSRLLCHALIQTDASVWAQPPEHCYLVGYTGKGAAVNRKYEKYRVNHADKQQIAEISAQLQADRRSEAVWYTTTNGGGGLSLIRKTLILK